MAGPKAGLRVACVCERCPLENQRVDAGRRECRKHARHLVAPERLHESFRSAKPAELVLDTGSLRVEQTRVPHRPIHERSDTLLANVAGDPGIERNEGCGGGTRPKVRRQRFGRRDQATTARRSRRRAGGCLNKAVMNSR
jgi:hypothetical protein